MYYVASTYVSVTVKFMKWKQIVKFSFSQQQQDCYNKGESDSEQPPRQ